MTDETSEIMTPRQVAEYVKVHQKTVYDWINSGDLNILKLGPRSIRIRKTDVDDFLEMRSAQYLLKEAKKKGIDIPTEPVKTKANSENQKLSVQEVSE